jgi:tRNA(Ile)-lysidine synthase
VSLDSQWLLGTLRDLENRRTSPARYLVALSGGLDSTVLLHLLANARHSVPVEAVHVDHALHPQSARWADGAKRIAESLGIACRVVRVQVGRGAGPEAAARTARYAALAGAMRDGDWILSAHHLDDQAETLLLNLMRGSGPEGLAAMPPMRRFGPGYLVRPLLGTPRSALLAYAQAAGLTWIDDPSNDDRSFDRNFLRQAVFPVLTRRWPDAASRIARSAALAGDVAALLQEESDRHLEAMGARNGRLPVAGLKALSSAHAAGAIRRAADRAGLPKPTASAVTQIIGPMLDARRDATPVVRWAGGECRRYRDTLYLQRPLGLPDFEGRRLAPGTPAPLGSGYGELALEPVEGQGLDPAVAGAGLVLRTRRGGEEIRPAGHVHTRKLKKLHQDAGVFPWLRGAVPLLYSGEALVAVADLWIAAGAAAAPGYTVRWRDAPQYR